MSLYNKLATLHGIEPITQLPVAVEQDGVDLASRYNFVVAANAVELVTEVLMDVAKQTDGISLVINGTRLRANDVATSVARNLENVVKSYVSIQGE